MEWILNEVLWINWGEFKQVFYLNGYKNPFEFLMALKGTF